MKPNYIDHIMIIVSDIAKTADFYSKSLGEPEQRDDEQVAFKVGDTKIFFGLACGEFDASHDKDRSSLNHLAFGVHSLDELKEFEKMLNDVNIKNKGIKIDKYGGKEFIWFDDPDNIRLEFYLRS